VEWKNDEDPILAQPMAQPMEQPMAQPFPPVDKEVLPAVAVDSCAAEGLAGWRPMKRHKGHRIPKQLNIPKIFKCRALSCQSNIYIQRVVLSIGVV